MKTEQKYCRMFVPDLDVPVEARTMDLPKVGDPYVPDVLTRWKWGELKVLGILMDRDGGARVFLGKPKPEESGQP